MRESEELLTECLRRLIRGTHVTMPMQATQHGEKLMRIVQRVTELPRTGVGLFPRRSGLALRGSQRRTQREKPIHCMLETRRGCGECLAQRQAFGEVTDGFHMG